MSRLALSLCCACWILGCAAPRPDIYKAPELSGGILIRDFVWKQASDSVYLNSSDRIHYNRAFIVKNVHLDTAYFAEREAPDFEKEPRVYERENILEGFKPGDESYLVIFRNFRIRNFPYSPGSFQVILKLDRGIPVMEKSIVYAYNSPGPAGSNSAWFPRQIRYEADSLDLRAGNRHSRDSLRVRAEVHIDSLFGLDDYRAHFKAIHGIW